MSDFSLEPPAAASRSFTGMGAHQSAIFETDVWLTPPEILKAIGEFDLDPCSPVSRPWNTAKNHFTIEDNGLSKEWIGRVYMNPPYGPETDAWLARLAAHGDGIALVFARTETAAWFRSIWGHAAGVLFLRGRLNFHRPDGRRAAKNAGAPSALIAYGLRNLAALRQSGIAGCLVTAMEIL